jgi:hypothetical protein
VKTKNLREVSVDGKCYSQLARVGHISPKM